jgi:hypothetical protein
MILNSLDLIQDEKTGAEKESAAIKERYDCLHKLLCAFEVKLRQVSGLSATDGDHTNDVDIMDRIQELIDTIVSPTFSEQFMRVPQLNDYFRDFTIPPGQHPREYLPSICEKHLQMEHSIDVIPPFIEKLDRILSILDAQLSTFQHFEALQTNVNGLHAALEAATGAITIPPILIIISRFVALVQALILQLGSATNNLIRIV